MWDVTVHNLVVALVLGLCFGFGFAVGVKLSNALFGPGAANV